jgi:hypothetical protein
MNRKLLLLSLLALSIVCMMSCNNNQSAKTACPQDFNDTLKTGGDMLSFLLEDSTELAEDKLHEKALAADTSNENAVAAATATCVDCGQRVLTADVDECVKAFAPFMQKHCLDDTKHACSMPPQMTDIYTDYEAFRGRELRKFMVHATKKKGLINAYKNMTLSVKLGVYTQHFVDTYGKKERLGRIGIFIMTCKRETKNGKSALVPLYAKTETAQDPDSFDFGGIHP